MFVTHKLRMDLVRRELPPRIDAVQDDRYSRNLSIRLFENGHPFRPPADCTVLVRYRKSDNIGGAYDTLPDGSRAWSIADNLLTVTLAPQVCTTAGRVHLVVTLLHESAELSSFTLEMDVQKLPGGVKSSREYINITQYLPQVEGAQAGQVLVVQEVDADGRVMTLTTSAGALPPPSSAVVGQYITVAAVDKNGAVTATRAVTAESLTSAEEASF